MLREVAAECFAEQKSKVGGRYRGSLRRRIEMLTEVDTTDVSKNKLPDLLRQQAEK